MKEISIKKRFTKYVTLNVLGMIGLSCYILADTFFVARGIGTNGLTALNLAIPIYSFIHGSGLMIGMGGATKFSITKDNDPSTSKNMFTHSLYYTSIMAIIFVITGLFFTDGLSSLLGSNDATHTMTTTYLKTILLFAPMFLLNNLVICFVRNDKAPRLSMIAMLVGSLSNIVLDYIFIFPLQMGMFGAAFATGIAPIVSLLVLSLHFIKKKNTFNIRRVKPCLTSMFNISSLGVSALITEVSSGVVIIIFNTIILRLEGNVGVAAYGIVTNIALVVIAVFTGIAQGMQPIISSCYGKEDYHGIKKTYKYGIFSTIIFAVFIYVFVFIFSNQLVAVFNKEQNPQLAQIAVTGLRIYFTAFLFIGINIVTATFFSAIAKPRPAFLISILRGFVVMIPTVFLLSTLFQMTGVWISLTIGELLVTFVAVVFYKLNMRNLR